MNPMDTTAVLPGQISWTCGTCRQSTVTGGLHIDLQEVRAAERAIAEWNRVKASMDEPVALLGNVMRMPPLARWRVECDGCRHSCGGCYMIELSQVRTAFALIRWTDHLYGKGWFDATDWVRFIANVARVNGSPVEATGVW